MPEAHRKRILTVLMQIVESDVFEIEKVEHEGGPNGEGSKSVKTGSVRMPNHRNQVAAAKAIMAAMAMDQQDEQHLERLAVDEARPQVSGGMSAAALLQIVVLAAPAELRGQIIRDAKARIVAAGGEHPEPAE